MKVSQVISNGAAFAKEDHQEIFLMAKSAIAGLGVPDEMIGDFILLLEAGDRRPRPRIEITEDQAHHFHYYGKMLASLIKGVRWLTLAQRLSANRRGRGRHGRRDEEHRQRWRLVVVYVVRQLTIKLLGNQVLDANYQGIALANHIAYMHWQDWYVWTNHQLRAEDSSAWLVDENLPVAAELLFRGRVTNALELWLNTELIQSCLQVRFLDDKREPRQLEVAPREGDFHYRSAGDFSGVRGVTKKLREDQIPKILPSEFNLMRFGEGDAGRRLTYDKLINRSPLCYQHFNPERPEIQHQICLPFILGAEPLRADRRADVRENASIKARQLAYALLVNAALLMPHHRIWAQVVFLERRRGAWYGCEFPLVALECVSSSPGHREQNLLEVDKLLPYFFVKTVLGARRDVKRNVLTFKQEPADCLARLARSQAYRAIFPAVIMRASEARMCVPVSPLVLPKLNPKLNTMLLCCCEDYEEDVAADFFQSFAAAQLAPMPLPEMNRRAILSTYLDMIIGPAATRKLLSLV